MSKQYSNNDFGTEDNQLLALVSIHIKKDQKVQIPIYRLSNIDAIIDNTIRNHNLNPKAKTFVKDKIQQQLSKINRHSQIIAKTIESQYVSGGSQKTKVKEDDQSFVLDIDNSKPKFEFKRVKKEDIDKSKISFQKMPDNFGKNTFFPKKSREKVHQKTRIKKKIAKKEILQKENISFFQEIKKLRSSTEGSQTNPCSPPTPAFLSTNQKIDNDKPEKERSMIEKLKKSEEKSLKKPIINDKKRIVFQEIVKKEQNLQKMNFIEKNSKQKQKKCLKLKTQGDLISFKQYNLRDLQKEMHEQIITLKMQKKVRNLEPQLSSIFSSIIKYNPAFIQKIHRKYASFDDLSEKFAIKFCEFLQQLNDQQIQNLDFESFKSCIVKYRAESLLQSIK